VDFGNFMLFQEIDGGNMFPCSICNWGAMQPRAVVRAF